MIWLIFAGVFVFTLGCVIGSGFTSFCAGDRSDGLPELSCLPRPQNKVTVGGVTFCSCGRSWIETMNSRRQESAP